MFLLDTLLIDGLRFVLDKVAAAADAEVNDEGPLRELLLDAQMRLELGEIDEAAFTAIERDVLARLREMRGGPAGALTLSGSEIEVGVDLAEELHDKR